MKRKITFLLAILMILSSFNVFAVADDAEIVDFNALRWRLLNKKTDFDDITLVEEYRKAYLSTMFAELAPNGQALDRDDVLSGTGLWKYGDRYDVQSRGQQVFDLSGNPNFIGYTSGSRLIPNIYTNENKMVSPTLVKISDYHNNSVPYPGIARPFKTDFTDPAAVGRMYLGDNASLEESEEYGRKIIRNWMHNTIARNTGWGHTGQSFTEINGVETVDKFIEHVAISIPPTSRTNGLAHVWFINKGSINGSNKGHTRRSFLISKTTDIDYLVDFQHEVESELEPVWDEETMTVKVPYKVKGLESTITYNGGVNRAGILFDVTPTDTDFKTSEISHESNFMDDEGNLKVEYGGSGLFNPGNGGGYHMLFVHDAEADGGYNFQLTAGLPGGPIKPIDNHELESLNRKKSETDVRNMHIYMGDFIGEDRPKDMLFTVSINYFSGGFEEYKNIQNNFKRFVVPATTGMDFKLAEPKGPFNMNINNVKTDVKVKGSLEYLFKQDPLEEILTDVVLYDKDGNELERKEDVIFTKDTKEQEFTFEIQNDTLTAEETSFSVVINADYGLTKSDPEIREPVDKLDDNKVEIKVVKPAADFEIKATTAYKSKEKDGKNIEVSFKVNLSHTSDKIGTTVVLYKGNTPIGTKNLKFDGGGEQTVNFSVPESSLSSGSNKLTAIVNADRALKVASPYTSEKDLSNNIAEMTLNLVEPTIDPLSECKFDGIGGTDQYKLKNKPEYYSCGFMGMSTCVRYVCDDDFTEYDLIRKSEVEYMNPKTQATANSKNGIFSDNWHNHLLGQKFAEGKGLQNGKNLKGEDAKDKLMTAVGINPLKQVIQGGAGIQVRTKIKVTGFVEEFEDYIDHGMIEAYIESFKTGEMFVSGKNVEGVSKDVRNNNGEYVQKMMYDATRSGELKERITDLGSEEFGVEECAPVIEVFRTEFEFEIPVIIDTATGSIDVIGGKTAKVPAEKKWFVYLNEFNDKYGLKVVTTIDPSLLGTTEPKTECILNHNDFKFGVYGTIFDNVNTENKATGDTPFWDN